MLRYTMVRGDYPACTHEDKPMYEIQYETYARSGTLLVCMWVLALIATGGVL